MGAAEFRLCHVSLERSFGGSSDVRVEREQAIAIRDLLESNTFIPGGHDGGPYRLSIALADARLALHIATEKGAHVVSHFLSLAPFRRLIKDYAFMCQSYYDAIAWPGPERLEAIEDSARDPQRCCRTTERASLIEGERRQRHRSSAVHADLRAACAECPRRIVLS